MDIRGQLNSITRHVTDAISSALCGDADKVLTFLLAEIQKFINFNQACVAIAGEDPKILSLLNSDEKMEIDFYREINIPVEGTVSGWVFENKKPLILMDLQSDNTFPASAVMESSRYFHSCISIPIYSCDKIFGVFTLWNLEKNSYGRRELLIMQHLAGQFSIAINTFRVYGDAQKRSAELAALMQVGEALASTMELDKLSRRVIDELDKVISFPFAGLYLYDEGKNCLRLVDAKGVEGEEREISQEEIMGRHPGMVFQTKEPLLVNDVSTDSRVRFPDVKDKNYQLPASLCYVPMLYQNRCLGIIGLASNKKNYFTQDHVRLVTAAARQVAIAFSRAQLYQREKGMVNKLQDVNKLKDEFIANVSHELRTPLTAVIGFSYLLKGGRLGTLSSIQLELIEDILTSAQNMLHLVEDLLDLSKLQARKIKLDKKETDLKAIVDEVITTTSIMANEVKVSLESHFEGDFSSVYIDPNRLRQVIMNLVTNAIKFNKEGGFVNISLQDKGDHMIIKVSDSGIGIKKEDQPAVFEQFRQIECGSSRRFRGTGLGLSITKQLIELHGGQILLYSEMGKGSTFAILLPKEQPKIDEGVKEILSLPSRQIIETNLALKKPSEKKFTILLVEDDKSVRKMLQVLFKDKFNFIIAKDGIDGLTMALRQLPDLILMDLALPDMDGYETTKIIKNNTRTGHIPIIALTARVTEGEMDKAALYSFDKIINKPFEPERLIIEINKFLLQL